MAYTPINLAEVQAGKPVKESLMTRIKNNLDDHEARISQLAGGVNQTVVFNDIIRFSEIPVGSAIWTWETEDQAYIQGMSATWIRADGTGTWVDGGGYSRATPNARSRFLRMALTYGPFTSTVITTEDQTKLPVNQFTGVTPSLSGLINTSTSGYHSHQWYKKENATTADQSYDIDGAATTLAASSGSWKTSGQWVGIGHSRVFSGSPAGGTNIYTIPSDYHTSGANAQLSSVGSGHNHTFVHSHSLVINGGGDSETSPKAILLNLIFKKAQTWANGRFLFKCPASFTITTVNLTKLSVGTTGSTATLDIRKGSLAHLNAGTGDISILTTPATITEAGVQFVEAAAVIKSDGSQNVSTGDWLWVNWIAKLKGIAEYHVQVIGS